jgi:mitochondrial chaperone BCS1
MGSALAADALNPFYHLGATTFGLPGVLLSAFLPQVQQYAKKWPRVWRLLSAAVAAHLLYQYSFQKIVRTLTYLISFCACSIKIYENDELMGCFTRWLDSQKPSLVQDSNMTGLTRQFHNINKGLTHENANFHSKSTGLNPVHFVLQHSYNIRIFRYKRRFFWISSSSEKGLDVWSGHSEDKKCLKIWTFGRSVKAIADILDEAVEHHANDGEKLATTMYIPSGSAGGIWDGQYDTRRGAGMWVTRAVKPCRPINTVYLDGDQRRMVTDDVARFLHPETSLRYRAKGIPHRRGYLMWGPPGNGKTSLAMALAGHFGLNVYSVSLRDPSMSDSLLQGLFQVLPPSKVLVLLEDIDSSGLVREAEFDTDEVDEINDWGYTTGRKTRVTTQRAITLSGVLNAIDGIAAPEGHILIMTSNAPDKLDKALIRPGRVDVKVEFKNASKSQLHDMFERMYQDESDASEQKSAEGSSTTVAEKSTLKLSLDGSAKAAPPYTGLPSAPPRLSLAELGFLAERFANTFPSQVCSLAEVQNYLLGKIDEPQRAIDEAAAWVEQLLKDKAVVEERKKQKAVEAALEQEEMKKRIKAAGVNGAANGVSFNIAGNGVPSFTGIPGSTLQSAPLVGMAALGGSAVVDDVADIEAVNESASVRGETSEGKVDLKQTNGTSAENEPKAAHVNCEVE